MEEHVIQPFHSLFPALDALQLIQTLCGLVAQQQGGKGADAHFQVILGGFTGHSAVPIRKANVERPVVPWQKRVLDLQLDTQGAAVRVTGIIGEEIFHIDDASHGIGTDALLDVAIVHLKGDGFAEIGAAVHLIDHGIMGMDILPQAFLGLAVEVDHLLDVHDVVFDEVDHVAAGLILDVVVDRNIGIVLVPAPVFLPGKVVPVETVVKTARVPESIITFRQGRSSVDASQLPNVERVASYMKKYPDSKVIIKGYASPEGNVEINAKIATARAEAVKTILVNKYKISASRITAEGQGVGDMFTEPDWNRVSVCTIED